MSNLQQEIKDTLRIIPDFPHRGIQFVDIMPVFNNFKLFDEVIKSMQKGFITKLGYDLAWGLGLSNDEVIDLEKHVMIDKVVAIESRGFLFGSVIASRFMVGFTPVRKPGKLPGEVLSTSYVLEYGHGQLQMQAGAIKKGERVLLVDDVLATGGSLLAAARLVEDAGGVVVGISVFYEIESLLGRSKLSKYNLRSLVKG